MKTNFLTTLAASVLAGCASVPLYVPPPVGEPTAPFTVALEGNGFGGVQICDQNSGWKLVGEVGDGASLHEQFFINYRVPPRSFKQLIPTGRRIKLGGSYSSNSGDPGAGYRVVETSSCVAIVSLVPDPNYNYDAIWKTDPKKGCSLIVYRLMNVNGNQHRVIDPTLERSDVSCH